MGVRLKEEFERERERETEKAIEATAHRFEVRATERNEFREREANNRLKWQAGGAGR